MAFHFRSTPVIEPFSFDSIGNHWMQENTNRPKGYPLYHYLQTEQGRGIITIQDKKYTLSEGEGVLIAPFIKHAYAKDSDIWITSFVTFTGTIENSIAKILGNRQVIFTEKEQAARISLRISEIIEKYEHPPVDARELSVDCYCLLMNFADGMYTHELLNDPLYQRYVAPVVQEIETNYDTDLTVQQLSGQVYVTPQYLSRLFGRFLGCSAYEYLTTFRLNKAKEYLLTHHRMPIQEIAKRVGYGDASHFIAMFKKVTGMTPLEFRKLN